MRNVLTAFIITMAIGFSFAQQEPVNVQILVQPPYSPHFEDYVLYENKVIVVLTGKPNPSMEPYQVYFKGVLEGSNGVMISTEENYKPVSPVEVPAGGTLTLQGADIDFFSTEHLTISGIDENDILFGDGLPEGYYQICVRAFDYYTDEPASPDEPLGCSQEFGIFHIDPPLIMLPQNGSILTPTEFQNITFSWTIPVNSPLNTEYILTLTELQEGQNPNDAADALSYPPLFESFPISTNSYIYSMADPILEEGNSYVARVRAYDPLNEVIFKNEGYSEVCVFEYGDSESFSFGPVPIITNPDCGVTMLIDSDADNVDDNDLGQNNLYVSPDDPLQFSWTPPSGVSDLELIYKLKFKKVPNDPNFFDSIYFDPLIAMNADDNFIAPHYTKNVDGETQVLIYPNETITQTVTIDGETETTEAIFNIFEPGFTYAFTVQAIDPTNSYSFSNDGISEVCWFTYKFTQVNILTPIVDVNLDIEEYENDFIDLHPPTVISGQLLTKYYSDAVLLGPDVVHIETQPCETIDTDYWNEQDGVLSSEELANPSDNNPSNDEPSGGIYNNTWGSYTGTGNFGNLNMNANAISNNNFVTEMANNLFFPPPKSTGYINGNTVNPSGAIPLKNHIIRLIARYSTDRDGDGFYKTQTPGSIHHFETVSCKRINNQIGNYIDKVIAVEQTDDQGRYSFSFLNDFETGATYTNENGEVSGLISLRIEIHYSDIFCSPDIHIFAKRGDEMEIPPQVALFKDFSIDINVVAADIANENTGAPQPAAIDHSKPIPKAIVQILKLNNTQYLYESLIDLHSDSTEIVTIGGIEYKQIYSVTADDNGRASNLRMPIFSESTSGGQLWLGTGLFVRIGTRAIDPDHNYEDVLYNYKSIFQPLSIGLVNNNGDENQELVNWFHSSGVDGITHNHFFYRPNSERTFGLFPNPPEIKGRLMVKSNLEPQHVQFNRVHLFGKRTDDQPGTIDPRILFDPNYSYLNNPLTNLIETTTTNPSGFFRFKNIPVDIIPETNKVSGPDTRFQTGGTGSKYKLKTVQDSLLTNGEQFWWRLKYGELKDLKDIFLEYATADVIFFVEDEQGNDVPAYLKVLSGFGPLQAQHPYFKTEPSYEYGRETAEGVGPLNLSGMTRIEVVPLSNQYIRDTIELDYNEIAEDPFYGKTFSITVFKKMHRLRLQVLDEPSGAGIQGVNVQIGDLIEGVTNNEGFVDLQFASPGQQFLVLCSSSHHTPKQESFNIPEGKDWHNEVLTLSRARLIAGNITEKNSGETVENALIYVELQSTDNHSLSIEAFSNSEGHYNLKGIPEDWSSCKVHVVKEGANPSYIGTAEYINLNSGQNEYNFQIEKVNADLSNIWGFPISIESMTGPEGEQKLIKGFFHSLPAAGGFSTYNENEKIPFETTGEFVADNNDPTKLVLSLENDFIFLKKMGIPIKIEGGFEGDLFNHSANYDPLQLKKQGSNTGQIEGALMVDLASFNFAYDFEGEIFIGNDTSYTYVPVFKSRKPGNLFLTTYKYYLFQKYANGNPMPIKDFRVFGFDATSTFSESYFQDQEFHIGATLHTDIPMAGANTLDLKIKVGDVVVTKTDVNLLPHPSNRIEFDLEEWKMLSTSGWHFDKSKDAIIVPKSMLITGKGINAPLKNLNIRPDALREAELDDSGGEVKLTLGNVVDLNLTGETRFNFDEGVGHYRLSVLSNNVDPAGSTENLQGSKINDGSGNFVAGRLEFNSIALLSDNTSVLSIQQNMRFYDVLDVYVDQIASGEDYFTLVGMPSMQNVPNLVATQAYIKFKKENGIPKPNIGKLDGYIDCNGNTTYVLGDEEGDQSIEPYKFTSKGKFYLKMAGASDDDNSVIVEGFMTKDQSGVIIDPIEQTITIGKEEMIVKANRNDDGIRVINSAWDSTLVFFCNTRSEGLEDDSELKFVVHGGIEVNSENIKATDINTPFGSLSLAYIFPESALVGELTITKLTMGFGEVSSGMAKMRIDPHGFFLGVSADVMISGQSIQGGFLFGAYGSGGVNLNEFSAPILVGFEQAPPNFNGLTGFYLIGQRCLVNESENVAGITFTAKAGIGAYLSFNFAGGEANISTGGYGFIRIKGGLDVGLCFVGAELDAFGVAEGGYCPQAGAWFRNCFNVGVSFSACGIGDSVGFGYVILLEQKNGVDSDVSWGAPNCDSWLRSACQL